MATSIRYLSGRDQFIGLGIAWPTDHPEWTLPLDPTQYPGAMAWTQEQLHYWSDGDRWIPFLNLPFSRGCSEILLFLNFSVSTGISGSL
jgi:hypothetical protein